MTNRHLSKKTDCTLEEGKCINDKKEYKEPASWTLITALDRVLDQAKESALNDEFWENCKNPINYLTEQLGLSKIQVVFLAIMVESGETMSWRKFGNYLQCSRLSMMVYSEELEDLVAKRWLVRRDTREMGGCYEGFALVQGVVTALRHNKPFVPEKIDGLTEQEFIDKLESHVDKNLHDRNVDFKDDEEWMLNLCKANTHLPLCHDILTLDDIHEQSLMLMIVFDFAQWADSDDEGLTFDSINNLYPEDFECDGLRRRLRDGSHMLIRRGFIENKGSLVKPCVD